MIIRAAQGGDVQRLAEFPISPKAPPWMVEAERWVTNNAWRWSRWHDGAMLLVAIESDVLVGVAGMQPWRSETDRMGEAPDWTVRGFAVARPYRHSGFGTLLLRDAVRRTLDVGARSLFWRAHRNNVVSHELAMKAGARIVGSAGDSVVFRADRRA